MKRYEPEADNYGGCDMCGAKMIEDKDGDYILYADYEKEKAVMRTTITEMLLPNISFDKLPDEEKAMVAFRNSYIDTYNNVIQEVLKKL